MGSWKSKRVIHLLSWQQRQRLDRTKKGKKKTTISAFLFILHINIIHLNKSIPYLAIYHPAPRRIRHRDFHAVDNLHFTTLYPQITRNWINSRRRWFIQYYAIFIQYLCNNCITYKLCCLFDQKARSGWKQPRRIEWNDDRNILCCC